MEKLKGLAIELDMDHLSVDRGLKGLKDNLRTVNSEMRRNMSAFDRSDRSVAKYETSLMGLNKKLEVQKVAVAEAKKEYEAMVDEYGRGSKEAEAAAREYNHQAASLTNLERYIERTKKELIDFEKQQRIANSSWTKVGNQLENYGGKLKGIGTQMNDVGTKMTNRITKPALVATTAAAGLVGALGWKRLTGLDAAQAQLKGLGYSTKEVGRISDQVTKAIDGGMTTMAEGTAVAAGALAAGVKEGKELERYIKLVGDAAVGANRPVEEMAMIFNRVQGNGKLMTQELNSIEQGMPGFSKAMSKHLGVSSEEFRKMVTEGKVSSKDFLDVMEDFAGGMASAYAESWDGMVANTKAYIGIIGENFLRGIFQDSKKSLADFIEMLKSPEIQQRAAEMGETARVAFNKMKDSIMDVVNWYQNLDDGQKQMIHRLGLMVVAGGPALQFAGKLTSGLGSVLEVTGKLSQAIGVARGAGLAAGLAKLGPGAIAGVAVVGIAAVATGLYTLHKRSKKAEEVNTELSESYHNQANELQALVDEYGKLNGKSRLTTKELGRLMDIQSELNKTQNPQLIAELNREYDDLAEKSGLSKDEINDLIDANNGIIKQSPEVEKSYTDQGNAIVESTDAVQGYINKLNEMAMIELQAERAKALEREAEIMEEQTGLREELALVEQELKFNVDAVLMSEEQRSARLDEIGKKLDGHNLTLDERSTLQEEEVALQQAQLGNSDDLIEGLQKQHSKILNKIDANDEELAKLKQIEKQMVDLLLSEVDITNEKGEGLKKLDETISKLEKERNEIIKNTSSEEKKTQEYRDQISELDQAIGKHIDIRDRIKEETGYQSGQNRLLDTQNAKLKGSNRELGAVSVNMGKSTKAQDGTNKKIDQGTTKAQGLNTELGKDIRKKLGINPNPSIATLNSQLSGSVSKEVKLYANSGGLSNAISRFSRPSKYYEKGTPPSGHPGGDFVAGEKGEELGVLPNGMAFLTPKTATFFPDMPRGTHVIPHRETKQFMRNIPGYADGTPNFGNSELARLLTLNNRTSDTSVTVTNRNENSGINKLLEATLEQNQILMQLLNKNTDVNINLDGDNLTDEVNYRNALKNITEYF